MDGILLVNKPVGISSFGVVSRVRGIIRTETGQKIKIGHTGTLDPAAAGLLVLVLGKYTKRAGEFSKLDKVYEVEAKLGEISSTGDREGLITSLNSQKPSRHEVKAALADFVGEIMQKPPAYSAIKVNGQRAYKLARAGREVDLEARPVNIFSIDQVDYNYPKLSFRVHVGSGTYIRSLVEDIGRKLNSGAYMTGLCRTKVGEFLLTDSMELDKLDIESIEQQLSNR